ncbi:MAG: TolC family protein [Steroidobacteraceae bacterium]|nr:TolC family protein [Steroidobacteraceae bacterium]
MTKLAACLEQANYAASANRSVRRLQAGSRADSARRFWAAALLAILGCVSRAQAQGPDSFQTLLEQYVQEGLRSNLALQNESLEVERAAHALAEARARFLPEVSLQARYTRADGGREIGIPLGSALNPAYATLNELLAAHGKAAQFPQLSDTTLHFLRREEQDTRIMAVQPLYAPAIPAAVRAQRALLDAANFNRMALARALRRNITIAYVDWLTARNSIEIVAASEALLRENLRVNQSLFEAGRVTEDQVLRAKAELFEVQQQQRETEDLARQARSYFNFLLNRDLQTDIAAAEPPAGLEYEGAAIEQLWALALDRRPEVAHIQQLQRASREHARIAETNRWPTLSLALDGGVQGEDFGTGEAYNFATVSLVFTWRLFDGGADRARERQARIAERQLVLRREETAQQIRLEVQQAFDRLATARASLATATARAEAARAAFRIASRKRDEGVISQVEFIDARSTLTGAELNLNITRFDVLARRAELEYATSSGDLPLTPGV